LVVSGEILSMEKGMELKIGLHSLEWVLFAEAAKGSHGATARHLLHPNASSTEFARLLNSLARNNHPRTNIITSPAEAAGLWPYFKGHAHFSTHASSYKSEGLSVHLFVTHPDTETTEDTPVIFHGKSDFEKPHAGSNVLSHFHIGSTGD
jgi:hypothetical protein